MELQEKNARDDLADLLLAAGPDAPTLCEGWLGAEMAVHLVTREARPDISAAMFIPVLRPRADRISAEMAAGARAGGYEELVERFRSGPPRLSPFSIPGADKAANFMEYFIHYLDVARAGAGEPVELADPYREKIWRAFTRGAGLMFFRKSPVGVVLERSDGPSKRIGKGRESVVLTGDVEDLVLFASGRETAADVELSGSGAAVAAFRGVRRSM